MAYNLPLFTIIDHDGWGLYVILWGPRWKSLRMILRQEAYPFLHLMQKLSWLIKGISLLQWRSSYQEKKSVRSKNLRLSQPMIIVSELVWFSSTTSDLLSWLGEIPISKSLSFPWSSFFPLRLHGTKEILWSQLSSLFIPSHKDCLEYMNPNSGKKKISTTTGGISS